MEKNTKEKSALHTQQATSVQEKPKRLSKAGQWLRDNPGGILEYVDWDAVNRVNGRIR